MEPGNDDMHMTPPRFDWSFNFGHVLTGLTTAAAVGGSIWWASERLAGFEYRLKALEVQLPILSSLTKSDNVQDERIGNIADSIRGMRNDIAESNRQTRAELVDVKKDVATVREGIVELRVKSSRN